MNRSIIAILVLCAVFAQEEIEESLTEEEHIEEVEAGTVKLVLFVLGVVTGLLEIVLYLNSFRRDNVVAFEVFPMSQPQLNVNTPIKNAESDRVIGSTN